MRRKWTWSTLVHVDQWLESKLQKCVCECCSLAVEVEVAVAIEVSVRDIDLVEQVTLEGKVTGEREFT